MSKTVVEVALGDVDLTADPSTYTWTDWSVYVEYDGGAGVQVSRGYRQGSDDPAATEIRFRGKNATKRWSLNNPNNPEFGRIIKGRTPIRASYNSGAAVVRATAILSEVILGYSANGAYQWADVTAYGRIQREETQPAARSALFNQVDRSLNVVYHLPGEDPDGSTVIESFVAGQPDAIADVNYAADPSFPGSAPLWTMGATSQIRATVARYAQPYPQQWAFHTAVRIPDEPSVETLIISVAADGGTIPYWNLFVTPGTPAAIRVEGNTSLGVNQLTGTTSLTFTEDTSADTPELFGQPVFLQLTVAQNGADVDWSVFFYLATTGNGFGLSGTASAQTVGPVREIQAGLFGSIEGWTFGHWTITNDDLGLLLTWDSYKGLSTRTAWFVSSLFAGIPVSGSITDTDSTVQALGTDRAIDAMKRAVRSEGGLMFEAPDGTVRMLARTELQNQAVALTINRNSQQIGDLQIIDDSLNSANQVTATSDGAGSATADAPPPYSPAEVGWLRNQTLDTMLETQEQLLAAAQWDAAARSLRDYRYVITLHLAGPASGLLATYLASVDVGSRVQMTNPQTGIVLDTIDQQVMGVTERMTEKEYDVTLNTRAAGNWRVFVVENGGTNLSRLATNGCVLLADLTTAATSAIVATNGGPLLPTAKWSTTAVPYDLAIRTFDRVTCTAVANNAPTFVAAGTAAHADNAAVTPGMPAGIVAGDLLLVLSSIRDSSGFGWLSGIRGNIVADQVGWHQLAQFGGANGAFALWGRQYTTGWPAPTLTPQSGSAGDTVSAQMAAFRYTQPLVHASGAPLANASAANIAYTGINIIRSGTVALLIVQKDDDWTSLAAPGGFTVIATPSSTLGTDQGIGWFYQIQTTATDIAGGSVVVTGGAANTSKAAVVALCGDAQTLTLTRAVNGSTSVPTHPAGSDVRLWRGGRMAQ